MPRVSKKNIEDVKTETPENQVSESIEVASAKLAGLTTIPTPSPREDAFKKVSRDSGGLLNAADYKFNEGGFVDWRAMVKAEYLYPNKDKFDADVDLKLIDITQVDDNKLNISLGGLVDLAQLRGFSRIDFEPIAASQSYCAVKCTITWIGNYETNMEPVVTSALAETHENNTENFAIDYLLSIGENRALARAIRRFLKINIVSKEELGSKKGSGAETASAPASKFDASSKLAQLMAAKGITFEQVKKKLVDEGYPDAESLTEIKQISGTKIFELINRLKAVKA
jgi:hypothetical protein